MRFTVASGSLFTSFSIIAGGVALMLPDQHWIGGIIMLIGVFALIFDVKFEHGHLATGSPQTLLERLKVIWPQVVIVFSLLGLVAGAWGLYKQHAVRGGPHSTPSPVPQTHPKGLAKAAPVDLEDAQINAPGAHRGALVMSEEPKTTKPAPKTEQAVTHDGRFVIQDVRISDDGKESGVSLGISVVVKNTGLGVAYAGTSVTNYAFFDPGPLPQNLTGMFDDLLVQARKTRPLKDVQQDAGSGFSFPVSVRLPTNLVDEMIAGKRGMAVWVNYAYYNENTPEHKIEVASLLLVYSGLGDGKWHESTKRQFTRTYEELS
jgi:hypothetical protein